MQQRGGLSSGLESTWGALGSPSLLEFPWDPILVGTRDRVLDFSFWGRTEEGVELAFGLDSRADSRCVLHYFSSRARLEGT